MIRAARICLFLFVATVVALGFLSAVATAGQSHCEVRQNVVGHHHAYQQYYVAPIVQNVFYGVGEGVQIEAAVQKALRADPDYALFQKFKQFKSTETGRPVLEPAPVPMPATDPADTSVAILKQFCGGCHSGAAPKAGLLLDGTAYIGAKTLAKCLDEMDTGDMPAARKDAAKVVLTREQIDAITVELARLVKWPDPE